MTFMTAWSSSLKSPESAMKGGCRYHYCPVTHDEATAQRGYRLASGHTANACLLGGLLHLLLCQTLLSSDSTLACQTGLSLRIPPNTVYPEVTTVIQHWVEHTFFNNLCVGMISRDPSCSDVELRQLNIWASPSANPGSGELRAAQFRNRSQGLSS